MPDHALQDGGGSGSAWGKQRRSVCVGGGTGWDGAEKGLPSSSIGAPSAGWYNISSPAQATDGAPIDDEGNPFSAPSHPVPPPTQTDLHCLPHAEPLPPPSCKAWSGCAHLSGECCPNSHGHFLGCC